CLNNPTFDFNHTVFCHEPQSVLWMNYTVMSEDTPNCKYTRFVEYFQLGVSEPYADSPAH
ncbi:MAG: hypothetical protein ABF409_09590, partial [Bifidobacterium sp.]|uniref:hypothetical protein n=1 Tax=Bifidobacterium sp. TaxID=41200 RepID=UPI0039EAEEBE